MLSAWQFCTSRSWWQGCANLHSMQASTARTSMRHTQSDPPSCAARHCQCSDLFIVVTSNITVYYFKKPHSEGVIQRVAEGQCTLFLQEMQTLKKSETSVSQHEAKWPNRAPSSKDIVQFRFNLLSLPSMNIKKKNNYRIKTCGMSTPFCEQLAS